MDSNVLLTISAFIGNILLGLLTLYKSAKSATNRLFFIFTVLLAVYLTTNYLSLTRLTSEGTHFWINTVMAVVPLLNMVFFLLVHTFPSAQNKLSGRIYAAAVFFTFLFIPLSYSNLIFTNVEKTVTVTTPTPGPAMPFFLFHVIVFLGGGLFLLFRKYKHSSGFEKKQLLLFIIGTSVLYGLTFITNYFLVLVFNITTFVGLLPLYSLFFAGCVSYAIVKHKFLDINYLVARAVSYTVLISVLAVVYTSGAFVAGRYFIMNELSLNSYQQAVLFTLTCFVALTFKYMEAFIQKITKTIFFKGRYNTDAELAIITKIVASTFKMEDLVERLKNQLAKNIGASSYYFLIFLKQEPIQYAFSMEKLSTTDIELLRDIQTLIDFDVLEETPVKIFMRNHGLKILLPMQSKNERIGYILLGDKQSGETYSEQDIQFLSILSDTLAVAFENARSYLEIKKFNMTLQQEVETATKELREANIELKELDKLKDEFVSLASHELRTPMAAIKGSLSTILEGYAGSISDQTKDFLTAAYNENDRLIRLVNNLLNTSRIESGRLNFTLGHINIDSLIQEVVHNMQIAVKEKNIFLKHETSGNVPMVLADEDKIKEVLINLIGNAIKFTSQGGITIRTEVKDQMVIISVQDTGTGIHHEDFNLLFKKFSQVKSDQKYTKTYGGTGLGLYLSQKIIEGLGGRIWLDSEVGKGTTFYFTLPITV